MVLFMCFESKLDGGQLTRRYIAPSHTKKLFANMRRQGKDFSGRVTPLFPTMVVQAQEEMGEGSAMPTDPHHTPIITQPSSSQPQRKQKSRRPKEKDTQVPQSSVPSDPTNVADEAVNEEPSMQLKELMDFCTKLQQRVLDLENTKTAQAQEITSLKKRVKKLEKKGGSRTHKLKRLYRVGRSARVVSSEEASLGDQEDASKQGRKIDDIDKDAEITLVDETQGRYRDEDMFGVNDLDGDEVVVESEVTDKAGKKRNIVEEAVVVTDVVTIPVSAATIANVELTLAQTLAELKSARPKTKGVVMQEPSESTPTISLQLPSQVKSQGSKDKDKAKMIKPEKPLKKKDQIKFEEEEALRLQAAFNEEDRLAKEKAKQVEEANIAWDDIQVKIDADYQLAERLQAQEQHELTIEKKSTLFQQLLEKRIKFFAAKRTEEKRNMPPTKAQQRSIICTYLKNMAGWKPKDLNNKSFANIQELFDKAMKRMLKRFDREDLETLWKLVKAKHGSTRPEEGYERVLWEEEKPLPGKESMIAQVNDLIQARIIRPVKISNLGCNPALVKKGNETWRTRGYIAEADPKFSMAQDVGARAAVHIFNRINFTIAKEMALWQSQIEDHTSDWLRVVSISGLGQTLNACSRVFTGDIYGDHDVSCAVGKEVDIGLDGGRDKPLRLAAMLLYSWDGGLDVYIGYGFLPFSFSSFGELEKDEVALLKRIRKFSMTQYIGARAAIHIFNRISFTITKGVGTQIDQLRYSYRSGGPDNISDFDEVYWVWVPFSFSSLGELDEDAVTLLKRIRKFSMAQDIGARVAAHIFNRIMTIKVTIIVTITITPPDDLPRPQVPSCSEQLHHVEDLQDQLGGFTLALLDTLFSKGLRTVKSHPPKCHLGFSRVLKGALHKVICKPDDNSYLVSLLVLPLCLLKSFCPRSNLECKSAIKRQSQEESIVNAIRPKP
ncbi:hypothetical protein Tco_1541759 [Tanacetum coccineum]